MSVVNNINELNKRWIVRKKKDFRPKLQWQWELDIDFMMGNPYKLKSSRIGRRSKLFQYYWPIETEHHYAVSTTSSKSANIIARRYVPNAKGLLVAVNNGLVMPDEWQLKTPGNTHLPWIWMIWDENRGMQHDQWLLWNIRYPAVAIKWFMEGERASREHVDLWHTKPEDGETSYLRIVREKAPVIEDFFP